MVYTSDFQRSGGPRRSSRWLTFLLPLTLLLALARLLARTMARAALALPRTLFDGDRLIKTLLWTTGGWFALRLTLFHHAAFEERWFAFDWLWAEAELLFVFPQWLAGLWGPWLRGYQSGHLLSVVKPWLLLLVVWTLGLHLVGAAVAAIRIGAGPDRTEPLPWPRPRAHAPLPFGFVATAGCFALWLMPLFALMLALPPRTRPIFGWRFLDDPIRAIPLVWRGLDWLILPRVVDGRMQALIARNPEWTDWRTLGSPQAHWRASTLAAVAIEIGVIALLLTVIMTAGWALRGWNRAAGAPAASALEPFGGGARRRAPKWAVIFLPVTLAITLIGRAVWTSPRWLPEVIIWAALLYVGCAIALFLAIFITLFLHAATNYAAMQFLRRWWRLAEAKLRYPAHWHAQFMAIPHGKHQAISNGAVVHGIVLLSLTAAVAAVPIVVALVFIIALGKRTLEGVAR